MDGVSAVLVASCERCECCLVAACERVPQAVGTLCGVGAMRVGAMRVCVGAVARGLARASCGYTTELASHGYDVRWRVTSEARIGATDVKEGVCLVQMWRERGEYGDFETPFYRGSVLAQVQVYCLLSEPGKLC